VTRLDAVGRQVARRGGAFRVRRDDVLYELPDERPVSEVAGDRPCEGPRAVAVRHGEIGYVGAAGERAADLHVQRDRAVRMEPGPDRRRHATGTVTGDTDNQSGTRRTRSSWRHVEATEHRGDISGRARRAQLAGIWLTFAAAGPRLEREARGRVRREHQLASRCEGADARERAVDQIGRASNVAAAPRLDIDPHESRSRPGVGRAVVLGWQPRLAGSR